MDAIWIPVIIAAITIIPTTIGAVASWGARKHARDASDSVNHRHTRGGMKVYDMAADALKLATQNGRMVALILQRLRICNDCPAKQDANCEHPESPTEEIIAKTRKHLDEIASRHKLDQDTSD